MKNETFTDEILTTSPAIKDPELSASTEHYVEEAFAEWELSVYAALETYSNVHRGSGHASQVTTHLYEQAGQIVLDHLGLDSREYIVVFLTSRRGMSFRNHIPGKDKVRTISSHEFGLALDVNAYAVKKNAFPKGVPFQTGGGTAKLMSKDWVIWAAAPDKFEAGTTAIINVIAFAKALLLLKKYGKTIFSQPPSGKLSPTEILRSDELESYSGKELLEKLRSTLIGRNIKVPTTHGLQSFINLDNSASTRTFGPVWNTFRETLRQPGQVQNIITEQVKEIVSDFLEAPLSEYEVIFTSNTTDSVNMVAESLKRTSEPVILNTMMEHSSNDLPWREIPGGTLLRLSVNREGFIDMIELESILLEYNHKGLHGNKRISLVAVSGASNVLGFCNNIKEISHLVHQYGAKILVDAAQLVAHRLVSMQDCGIDYLAFSAHKVYAPFGTGVLVARKGLLNFNENEMKLIQAYGGENAGGIAALGKSLLLLKRIGMDLVHKEEQLLTERMLNGMKQVKGLKIHGVQNAASKGFAGKLGVVAFSLKKMFPNKLAKELALQRGIGVRYGCHCAHIIVKHILHVSPGQEKFQRILQLTIPGLRLPGVLRVSLGLENSEADVDALLQVLHRINGEPIASGDNGNSKVPEIPKSQVKKQIKEFTKTTAEKVYEQTE